jgi:hypothetical protein
MLSLIKEAVNDGHIDMIMDDMLDEDNKYSIRLSTKGKLASTACWSFKKNVHHIFVGTKILENIAEKANLFLDEKEHDTSYYVQSYLYHEVAHSLFTEKDIKSMSNALNNMSIPFRVLNLFEDARIEQLMREKSKRTFNWMEFESKHSATDPLGFFFILIQHEFAAMDEEKQNTLIEEYTIDPRIIEHYSDTLKCKDSWCVLDVIERWIKDFPIPPNTDDLLNEMGMGTDSDMSLSLTLQENEIEFEQAISDSEESDDDSQTEAAKRDYDGDTGEKLDEFSSIDFDCGHQVCEIDHEVVRKLVPKLESIFVQRKNYQSTTRPSKRLAIKSLIRDNPKIYKRKKTLARAKRKFNIVVDCSGSMHGKYINGAASIASLFSSLASKNLLDGKVILSSNYGFQTFMLPISDATIETHFDASGGGEGFANTFEKVEPILKEGDITFVITDGHIGDGRLDKQAMKQKGIYTFGLYVGNPEECELDQWFHRGVAREKLSELIDELVRNILASPI